MLSDLLTTFFLFLVPALYGHRAAILRYGASGEAEVLLERPDISHEFDLLRTADPFNDFGIETFPKTYPIKTCVVFRAKQDGKAKSLKQHEKLAWFNIGDLSVSKAVSKDMLLLTKDPLFEGLINELNLNRSCNFFGFFPHLAAIWESTLEHIQGTSELIEAIAQSNKHAVKVSLTQLTQAGTGKPEITVKMLTPIEAAKIYGSDHAPVLLACMGNNRIAGGYFRNGGVGLEEDICRVSTLGHILSNRNDLYPINFNYKLSTGLYIPGVIILREGSRAFQFFEMAWLRKISVCLIPALDEDSPEFSLGNSLITDRLKDQVALQFEVADRFGAEVLIASDFGVSSGTKNEASTLLLINIYHQFLKQYHGNIKKVVFAIPNQPIFDLFRLNMK